MWNINSLVAHKAKMPIPRSVTDHTGKYEAIVISTMPWAKNWEDIQNIMKQKKPKGMKHSAHIDMDFLMISTGNQ